MSTLYDVLATTPLFTNFAETDLTALAGAMRERTLAPDAVLFREGQRGDAMVVVSAGELIVEREQSDGQTLELAHIGLGDIVGEMSAIDPAPRLATVRAIGEASVHVLDRTMLDALMSNAPTVYTSLLTGIGRAVTERLTMTNKRIRHVAFGEESEPVLPVELLDEAPGEFVTDPPDTSGLGPLAELTTAERETLLVSAPIIAFKDGDIVCAEGRPGYSCFIVGGGALEIVRQTDDEEHLLAVMTPGAVVGQLALLNDIPRSATVRAKGDTWLVALGRGSFNRILKTGGSLGLKLHSQVIVAGIRQLRLASRMLTEMTLVDGDEALAAAEALEVAEVLDATLEEPTLEEPTREELMATLRKAAAKFRGEEAPAPRKGPLSAERLRRSRQAWRAVDTPKRAADGPKRTPTRELALYVTTALNEWGLSLEDLEDDQPASNQG